MIALLVVAFVLSGAAGLIYESIWSRYLGLFVGHSAYAQIIVLVIFLGGMSLGAHLASRWSARLRSPLLWYAIVEAVVGLMALVFHDTFRTATAFAYDSLFPATGGATLTIVKWAIAGALILPQSILLGTTFPLMTAGVIRVAGPHREPGRLLGLLYFANSLGAAGGVLLAGFFLIKLVGLPGTLLVAGAANILVAVAVGLLARAHDHQMTERSAAENRQPGVAGDEHRRSEPAGESTLGASRAGIPEWRPLLVVAFGTAVASFIYEIAWIRMLSLVLGSATHSFEMMLSAFILGLALGALWIRKHADRIENPVRWLGVIQWVMGGLAVATLPLYVESFEWISTILRTVEANEQGYRAFLVARYLIALVIMLPATFCAGMTLPLITRVLMRAGGGERAIGMVYAVNTLGSILGVVIAGLVLMPLLGLKLLLVFGAAIDIALGVWLVVRSARQERHFSVTIPLIATGAAIVVIAMAARFDHSRITSGVYRHGVVAAADEYTFPFYRDGRTATISVRRGHDGFLTLASNGKPDASMDKLWLDSTAGRSSRPLLLTRDIATQMLLPVISLAHVPRAEQIAVIGFGSGMSSHVLLGSPHAREVVTIEIEPAVIEASRHFRPANHRIYDDPRSRLVVDDAKSYFAAAGRKFDLILSEPSNPWVSGVSGLFTTEFYQRVKVQLAPHGVFGQWLHLYELSDGLVSSVLAALDSAFPHYEVFFTSNADILVVASNDSLPTPNWDVVRYDGIAHDLRFALPLTAETLEALRLAGRDVLHPVMLARGAGNSDFFPALDLGAEESRFMHTSADGYTEIQSGDFNVVAALAERRIGFGRTMFTPTPEIARPSALAFATRIRAVRSSMAPPNSIPRDDELRDALYRIDQLERTNASSRPPADWNAWMKNVIAASGHLHGGTSGVVDADFFAAARRYASRFNAPQGARAGVEYLEGIASWNWPQATAAAQTLLSIQDTTQWIPDVLLRNGAAVAYIKLREFEKAKAILQVFARRTAEDAFRDRLIGSYLIYADTTMRKKIGWK